MTSQHDTPEAVEMAAKYAAAATPDAGYTAAMLRRLHARAVAAEAMCAGYRANESDLLAENDALRFERNNLAASLATARADALREAAAEFPDRVRWFSPEETRSIILALIEQEPRHD